MIKLIKKQFRVQTSSGFGFTETEWVVKGHEHIVVEKRKPCWIAWDTSGSIPDRFGFEGPTRIARKNTKKEMIQRLSEILL